MDRRELQAPAESVRLGLADRLFTIDVRAVAALRIGLRFLILWNILHILPYAREFLSGDGMVPWRPYSLAKPNIFLLGGGSAGYSRCLLSVYAVLAGMIVLGFPD